MFIVRYCYGSCSSRPSSCLRCGLIQASHCTEGDSWAHSLHAVGDTSSNLSPIRTVISNQHDIVNRICTITNFVGCQSLNGCATISLSYASPGAWGPRSPNLGSILSSWLRSEHAQDSAETVTMHLSDGLFILFYFIVANYNILTNHQSTTYLPD